MKYNYVAFKDEVGKVYVVRDTFVSRYAFGGSTGKIIKIECGTLEKHDDETNYLKSIMRKIKELENIK